MEKTSKKSASKKMSSFNYVRELALSNPGKAFTAGHAVEAGASGAVHTQLNNLVVLAGHLKKAGRGQFVATAALLKV